MERIHIHPRIRTRSPHDTYARVLRRLVRAPKQRLLHTLQLQRAVGEQVLGAFFSRRRQNPFP